MLEARVVATSTQRPAIFEQGVVAGRERITLSSQGSWSTGNIFSIYLAERRISERTRVNLELVLDKLHKFFRD
jgi:hypothetical protein